MTYLYGRGVSQDAPFGDALDHRRISPSESSFNKPDPIVTESLITGPSGDTADLGPAYALSRPEDGRYNILSNRRSLVLYDEDLARVSLNLENALNENLFQPEQAAGMEEEPAWIDFSKLTDAQRELYPSDMTLLADRVRLVKRLYESGALAEEFSSLGLVPEWLDRLHQEGTRVVISEQQQFIMSLFSSLDDYGTPRDMQQSIRQLEKLKDTLAEELGAPVEAGFLTSRHHGASFDGISFGGYITLGNALNDEFKQVPLFSKKDREFFGYAAYQDLSISEAKIAEITKSFEQVEKDAEIRSDRAEASARKQQEYNASVLEKHGELPQEKAERVIEQLTVARSFADKARAARNFLEDWKGAVEDCREHRTPDGRMPYMLFVEKFNERFARRIVPSMEFKTFYNDVIDTFPSLGVADWPKFITALRNAGILTEQESICRLRTVESNGRVRYCNTWIEEIKDGSVRVNLKMPEPQRRSVDIAELAEESRRSLEAGNGPTLVPIGKLRYLLNLAFSPSLILYDGADYQSINKVINAIRDPNFLLHPREPKIHTYTRLCEHQPADSKSPWTGLEEKHQILDYYRHAAS